MSFVYILICLSLISHTFRISVVDFLIENFYSFHLSCLKSAPDHVRSVESLQALVCGKNFSDAAQSNLLIASGLIHLFVVSGAHLQVLQKILRKLKLCNIFILALLFIYCAICKFNAPIVRSFLVVAILVLTENIQLKWRLENVTLVSGLLCLILSPAWVNSLSLQMSWIAALTLSVIAKFFLHQNSLFKNSLFYLHYLGTFNFIGIPQPVSIVLSTVMTTFLELILFPLALAVYILPFLGPAFDLIIQSLNLILAQLELNVIFRPYDSEKLIVVNWVLICALHFFLQNNRQARHA